MLLKIINIKKNYLGGCFLHFATCLSNFKIKPTGIVRESGNIKKCFDEFFEDFVISDELRKVIGCNIQ